MIAEVSFPGEDPRHGWRYECHCGGYSKLLDTEEEAQAAELDHFRRVHPSLLPPSMRQPKSE